MTFIFGIHCDSAVAEAKVSHDLRLYLEKIMEFLGFLRMSLPSMLHFYGIKTYVLQLDCIKDKILKIGA